MTQKQTNHERAPLCAAFVNGMREVFGADHVKVVYVEEGGVKIGALDAANAY